MPRPTITMLPSENVPGETDAVEWAAQLLLEPAAHASSRRKRSPLRLVSAPDHERTRLPVSPVLEGP